MTKNMTFLPRANLLSLEELSKLSHHFIDQGIRKIRISGGEPLVRKDIMELFKDIAPRLGNGLDELTLTTNATQLSKHADQLAAWGINRINISLDSLDRGIFAKLSRRDVLPAVLGGIQAAKEAGLSVKINTVVLPENLQHLPDMVEWAHAQDFDISFIEIMPMGKTDVDRRDQYIPIQAAKDSLQSSFDLSPLLPSDTLGGPARYHFVSQTKGRIGFISPLTNNFCASCNRIRLTCTGRIYMCLGQDAYIDLRETLRSGENLNTAIHSALDRKPLSHDFAITDTPSVARHMSVTGG